MSASNLPGVTGCGGKYCVDCGTVHRPDTGDLASAQMENARLRAELARVTEERDELRCRAESQAQATRSLHDENAQLRADARQWRGQAKHERDMADRARGDRDRARELLASTVAQCERHKMDLHGEREAHDATLREFSRVLADRDKFSVALSAALEQLTLDSEALSAIRDALDRRNLCYACAEPREDHTDDCSVCAGTMCVSCCSDSA